MTIRRCDAVRHLPYEDLGYFDQQLRAAGYEVRYVDAPGSAAAEIEGLSPDLLVVLGGPLGATDENEYPFVASELKLLERRLAENLPTLGICLGGQLMARTLGATVERAEKSEIGWIPLQLSGAGESSALRYFDEAPVFHWHGDAFELPAGAVSLASTPDCAHQAFSCGPNLLGLQFHPEVTPQGLETWYVGHYRALQDAANPDVHTLRTGAARYGAALKENGSRFLREWLAQLET